MYVNVPLGDVGGVTALVFELNKETIAVLAPLVPLVPVPLITCGAENSAVGMLSVAAVLDAVANARNKNSPAAIAGGVCDHPLSVPPLKTPVLNVYVNVPLKEAGGVVVVFLLYRYTVALFKPAVPPVPSSVIGIVIVRTTGEARLLPFTVKAAVTLADAKDGVIVIVGDVPLAGVAPVIDQA